MSVEPLLLPSTAMMYRNQNEGNDDQQPDRKQDGGETFNFPPGIGAEREIRALLIPTNSSRPVCANLDG
jgi:hypothetical protein